MDLFSQPLFQQNKILRKTKEKVEIIACMIKQPGIRNDDDWVTYIDSTGMEHIKEHLNIQLDFKDEQIEKSNELLNITKECQSSSIRNQRIFEIAKVCVEQHGNILNEDEIVKYATSLVDKIGIEYDNK